MKKSFYTIIGIIIGLSSVGIAYAQLATFTSKQVGTNPINGYCLTTNGATSTWSSSCGSGGGGGSASAAQPFGGMQYSILSGTSTILAATSSMLYSTSTNTLKLTGSLSAGNGSAILSNANLGQLSLNSIGSDGINIFASGGGELIIQRIINAFDGGFIRFENSSGGTIGVYGGYGSSAGGLFYTEGSEPTNGYTRTANIALNGDPSIMQGANIFNWGSVVANEYTNGFTPSELLSTEQNSIDACLITDDGSGGITGDGSCMFTRDFPLVSLGQSEVYTVTNTSNSDTATVTTVTDDNHMQLSGTISASSNQFTYNASDSIYTVSPINGNGLIDRAVLSATCVGTHANGALYDNSGSCGGGGTNYFSNSGSTTTLSTGTKLAATLGVFGTIAATSTATSTISGKLNVIGSTTVTDFTCTGTCDLANAILGPFNYIQTSSTTATSTFAGPISTTNLLISGVTSHILKTDGAGLVRGATGDTDYQNAITLTTSGSSGAATFSGDTLNIPQYSGGGGGGGGDMLANLVNAVNHITSTATATTSTMNYVTGGPYTVYLPLASANMGKLIGLRMGTSTTAVGLITIQATSTDLIDGQSSRIMWANETATLYSDGLSWIKVAGKSIPMTSFMDETSAQNIPNGSVTDVTLDTIVTQNVSMGDTSNHRINILRQGIYTITAEAVIGPIGTSDSPRAFTQISGSVNGAAQAQITTAEGFGKVGGYPSPVAVGTLTLYKGDWIKMGAYQSSGVTQPFYTPPPGSSNLQVTEVPSW